MNASEEKLIDERDDAQEAVSQIYYIVFGHAAEWSNLYGIDNAVEDIIDMVNCLKMENQRIVKESQQCHEQNDSLVKEHLELCGRNITLSGALSLLEYDAHGVPKEYPEKAFVESVLAVEFP
jgi:hypothetical protein